MTVDEQRVALVTGSSRGLGAVIARRLARDGLAVAVNGRSGDAQVHEVARAIAADGGTAGAFAADVTDEREVAGLAAAVSARLGAVEVLVLNATGPQPEAPLSDVAWEDHLTQLSFFVKSPVLLGRALLAGMRARGSGRIIQIDSEVADRPPPGRSAYATAKSAQIGLTRSWARELAPSGSLSTRSRRVLYLSSATQALHQRSATPTERRCPLGGWEPPTTSPTP
jgi:3-oxoacyl-[acyl-carrier protein] reductase